MHKSKFLVVAPNKRRALYNLMCDCQFFNGGKPLENVIQYRPTHLGHIISSTSSDTQDVIYTGVIVLLVKQQFSLFFESLRYHGEAQTI